MNEKTKEPALKMSYEELEMESKMIDKALDLLAYETLTNLNAIPAPVATTFTLENDFFILTFGLDQKHTIHISLNNTDDGELFISLSTDDDYLNYMDITNPTDEFFEIMIFYNKLSVTLNNPKFLKEVSDIIINYYQESKHLLKKSLDCHEAMQHELMLILNEQKERYNNINKIDEMKE